MKRKIIKIDESKCNGCGLCVNACAEGAIQMVNGKAKLVSDNYCDGLGACLGECPQGAIKIIEREANAFDEVAVKKHLEKTKSKMEKRQHHEGCPGMAMHSFEKKNSSPQSRATNAESELTQWPVQLHLVSPSAPYWAGSDLIISADCVPFTYANFHSELLKGKKLVIACPKLDDTEPYLEKLIEIIRNNDIRSVTVARMEVPCCGGIAMIAQRALQESGKDIPFKVITISIRGEILDN